MASIARQQEYDLAHVIITRFNLPTPGPESLIRAKDGWLSERWDLFRRYTIPSIRQQTSQDFHWFVYFDVESPGWLKAEISIHEAEGLYTPLFKLVPTAESIAEDIRSIVPARRELITTNLDNDDGLAIDFVARLQAHTVPAARAAVYFKNGLIRTDSVLFLRVDRDNAFCSVRELWSDPVTCWKDWHVLLGKHMPVSRIGGHPAWLQVVHGTNVSNRVRGKLVGPTRYRARFRGLLEDIEQPGVKRLFLDRIAVGPVRWLRNAARGGARRAILAVAGKDGLDQLKNSLTKVRSVVTPKAAE